MQLVVFEHERGTDTRRDGRGVSSETLRPPPPGSGLDDLDLSAAFVKRTGALAETEAGETIVIDLNRTFAAQLALEDVGAPEAEADSLLPHDILEFLDRGSAALDLARSTIAWATAAQANFDGPDLAALDAVHPRRNVRLCAPVPKPGKLVGIEHNYAAHAQEMGKSTTPVETNSPLET